MLLVNTPKADAITYAQRVKSVIEGHRFVHGPLSVSVGIAALPEDVASSDDLMPAAPLRLAASDSDHLTAVYFRA